MFLTKVLLRTVRFPTLDKAPPDVFAPFPRKAQPSTSNVPAALFTAPPSPIGAELLMSEQRNRFRSPTLQTAPPSVPAAPPQKQLLRVTECSVRELPNVTWKARRMFS